MAATSEPAQQAMTPAYGGHYDHVLQLLCSGHKPAQQITAMQLLHNSL